MGFDFTVAPSWSPVASMSISAGYTTNPDLRGWSTGATFGIMGMGCEISGDPSLLLRSPYQPYTGDYQIGLVFSTSPVWFGVNAGYTNKIR